MARSKKKSAGRVAGVMLGVLLVVVVAGAATYLAGRGPSQTPQAERAMETVTSHKDDNPARTASEQTIKIYVVKVKNDESVLVPQKVEVSDSDGKYHAAVSALLEEAGSQSSAIPEGTKIHSLEISGDLAIIDLTKEFVDNFSGGSEEESLAINSIAKTMGQFPEIKKVQILVEGKKIGSLGGHFEIDEPIDVETEPQNSGE